MIWCGMVWYGVVWYCVVSVIFVSYCILHNRMDGILFSRSNMTKVACRLRHDLITTLKIYNLFLQGLKNAKTSMAQSTARNTKTAVTPAHGSCLNIAIRNVVSVIQV